MVRGIMEWVMDEPTLQLLFQNKAPEQYTRVLTLTALVKLLIQVSAGVRAAVFAAYQVDQDADEASITTSSQARYGKIGRINPAVSEALVRHSADKLTPLLQTMPAAADEPLPGYRLRIVDGNILASTDHRLTALRRWLNACLPGKSSVVYQPALGLVSDLVLCEDAYTQERALLVELLPGVQANDLWLADRNFCTPKWVFGIQRRQGFFVVRQHKTHVPCQPLGRWRKCGTTATGVVYEQAVRVTDPETGQPQTLGWVQVRLFEKSRDGERTITLLTNLPDSVLPLQIAERYRLRWTIEKHFPFLSESLHSEVASLGKPRAALLLFAMALVAGNALALVRGSLRQAHGTTAAAEVSGYYLADEMAGDYRAVMKYQWAEDWLGWRGLEAAALAKLLTTLATQVRLGSMTRSQRGAKKPRSPKPVYNKQHKHFSTARLLKEADNTC